MAEAETLRMAKSRALLTETEREQIAGEHGRERKYQATSRIRSRIEDELTTDVEILKEYHPDLLDELRDVACKEGRHIYCPICGQEFDIPTNAFHHLTGSTTHGLSKEEAKEVLPEWWYDEQENLSSYVGHEG